MSTYELPDGFEGMETCPYTDDKEVFVNVLYINGRINPIEQWRIHNTPNRDRIGWSPVVPPKKKRRFKADWCSIRKCWTVRYNPPTVTLAACLDGLSQDTPEHRNAAQAVADIYEQAYEGGV